MNRILIIFFLFASLASDAQNTWVQWGTHWFLKQGSDSTDFGEDHWSTLPNLVSALNSKQPILGSGTNIKTIKGQPVLGSGDIPIVWGDLTGTLSNQTDLQTAFNAKQATLVSATNIKTINGSSILGSGDLVVSASAAWGGITGTLSSQTDLQNALDLKANIASPTFTGTVGGITSSMVGLGNVNNTSDASKPISTATQSALDAKQATLVSGTTIKTINGTTLLGSGNIVISGSGPTRVFLPSDQINNNAVANTIQDVTGLSFPVVANTTYQFKFVIIYNSAATTTGSRWSINGPATTHMSYTSQYPTTATAITNNAALAGYNLPAASNASSLTTNNRCIIEGEIRPSADGTVIARFASEILSSAITAVASGRSYVEYQIIN